MNELNYMVGDASLPEVEGHKIIVHVCNDLGMWGSGFVLSLRKNHPISETNYRVWAQNKDKNYPFKLGEVQFVQVDNVTWVANMIAQHGIYKKNGIPPIRYDALETCLNKVLDYSLKLNSPTIHMPRIGCGLAGGRWHVVEDIIKKTLCENLSVFVYDLKEKLNLKSTNPSRINKKNAKIVSIE